MCVETANGVSLDYDDRWEETFHHYAFLVSEEGLVSRCGT